MSVDEALISNLVIRLLFAAVCAAIASSKGRNPFGWFLIGFLISCIGLIIILCLPDLNETEGRFQEQAAKTRRLKEQLRQEQMKLEHLQKHTAARLDRHDTELGVDTRGLGPALPAAIESPPGRPPSSEQSAPTPAPEDAIQWFYVSNDQQVGPLTRKEIEGKIMDGILGSRTLVWNETMTRWTPLSDVPELKNLS